MRNNKSDSNEQYYVGSGKIFVNPSFGKPTDPANVPNFKAPVMTQGAINCRPKSPNVGANKVGKVVATRVSKNSISKTNNKKS